MNAHFSPIVAGLWRLAKWSLSSTALASWISDVLDQGVDTFDLADIYGSYTCEALFGDALRSAPGLRDKLRLVTKCGIKVVSPQRPAHTRHGYDTSREHIVSSVEASLRALGTDHVEVLLLHRQDPLMDPAEVAAAFDALEASGKVQAFGVSNFTPSHFAMLAAHVRQPLVTNQVEASVLRLEPIVDGTFDQCLERRMRPMAWSPLGGGRLFTGDTPEIVQTRTALRAVADQRGVPLDTVAYAFLLRHPARPHPITGTRRLDRIVAAVAALDLELTREEWFDLYCAAKGSQLP
jgi:predicted oxidoreductase